MSIPSIPRNGSLLSADFGGSEQSERPPYHIDDPNAQLALNLNPLPCPQARNPPPPPIHDEDSEDLDWFIRELETETLRREKFSDFTEEDVAETGVRSLSHIRKIFPFLQKYLNAYEHRFWPSPFFFATVFDRSTSFGAPIEMRAPF